nr:SRPBCC family protein [Micromonospora sp. NBS 11-29]
MASSLTDKARDQLGGELRNLASAIGERAVRVVTERVTGATGRLSEYAQQGGGSGLVAAATGAKKLADGQSPMKAMFHAGLAGGKEKLMSAFGGGGKGGKGGKKQKVTNIVETIEVGVPVRVAYNQWTTFGDFPSFMKKVEQAENDSDEKMTWKAQVFWSHRSWESTIVRQIPDRLIHWRSKGEKGAVDGTVSFHEVGSELTRILVVLEYHPQGLFEHTGNLWRAQGRRARLELKHFVRHVMTQTVLDPDSVEGWRGEIEDSQVVKDHETALREEQEAREQEEQGRGEQEEQGRGGRPKGREEEPEEEPEEERPAGRDRRRPPQRRRPAEDEEYDDYDSGDDFDDEEYEEEPRRRQPERARRPQREDRDRREDRGSRADRDRDEDPDRDENQGSRGDRGRREDEGAGRTGAPVRTGVAVRSGVRVLPSRLAGRSSGGVARSVANDHGDQRPVRWCPGAHRWWRWWWRRHSRRRRGDHPRQGRGDRRPDLGRRGRYPASGDQRPDRDRQRRDVFAVRRGGRPAEHHAQGHQGAARHGGRRRRRGHQG